MDWKIRSTKHVNALVLISHPDDETIFCGGTILSHPLWNWTIICVTMQEGTSRMKEYEDAIAMYRRYGVTIVFANTLLQKDEGHILTDEEVVNWEKSIDALNLQPDIVFTHNTQGDYGHPHHISLNLIAHTLYDNVWEFICSHVSETIRPPLKARKNIVEFDTYILQKKALIFDRSYPTQHGCRKSLKALMDYEFTSCQEIFTAD